MPNPQDALPLPPRPNLERYKKLAKELAKACKSGYSSAIGDWVEKWIETLAELAGWKKTREVSTRLDRTVNDIAEFAEKKLRGSDAAGARCRLADAQFVLARSHGFESWPKFAKHLGALTRRTSDVAAFEAAADAIVRGDAATLKRLLRQNPELIQARSTREHRATLLHYCSANGVEGYRQQTPKNIVEIAEILLRAGADVDAEADVYGGGATTLGLVATSVNPERAGVQNALLQTLLDHGATIDQARGAGNDHSAVLGCLANGRGKAAEFLANHGATLTLESAAGAGRLDVVKSFFHEDGRMKASATKAQLENGFVAACTYGRTGIVEFLLRQGINIATRGRFGQTGLHGAAIGGQLDIIKLLLERRAPLEIENEYGGTVLGQTLYSAAHGGDPELYVAILEILIASGAKVPERHPPVNTRVDEVLRRYGSEPENSWYWYGEKPRRSRS
jgi:ankyrin repeat protein